MNSLSCLQILLESDVEKKIDLALSLKFPSCQSLANLSATDTTLQVPLMPARGSQILAPALHPNKKGLSFKEGQARLMHDLASIELQAMELGLRTLIEFPNQDEDFRHELFQLVQDEAKHLEACVQTIKKLGFRWGDWPVHTMLWQATAAEDSILDRIFIVHRYLEGSGLDAGAKFLQRLASLSDSLIYPVVNMILTEEVQHVAFGSQWYRKFCQQQELDMVVDFENRFRRLLPRLPKRIEKLNHDLRLQAGFSISEIQLLEDHRSRISKF